MSYINNIQILDCTLRDGGYINDWKFGNKVIKRIIKKLVDARIEIIECGFLSECEYNNNRTIFNNVSQINELIPNSNVKFVAMVALGEKEIACEKISECENNSIFGIRLTFHKEEMERAFEYAENLMNKGYEVFMQPVGTITYSDIELLKLVENINKLKPYAFYIVDTLGTITSKELVRLFHMIDNNLEKSIKIGFHSHNNLQLAFANAQELINLATKRKIIIDSSIQGMGRGAGNLCTELLANFMNEKLEYEYNVTDLLEIIDKYLEEIKRNNPWGYMIPYYLSAVKNCHPNYATFLINKQTINVRDIERIINNIPIENRDIFDKELIALLYQKYQDHLIDDKNEIKILKSILSEKNILLVAPGSTIVSEVDRITQYIEKYKPYIIGINYDFDKFNNDMIFISNLKRYDEIDLDEIKRKKQKLIATSNIKIKETDDIMQVNYSSYLNADKDTFDDAGIMLLNLLEKCDVKKVALAGFDGFARRNEKSTNINEAGLSIQPLTQEDKTMRIAKQLKQLSDNMEIHFVTTSEYNKER